MNVALLELTNEEFNFSIPEAGAEFINFFDSFASLAFANTRLFL